MISLLRTFTDGISVGLTWSWIFVIFSKFLLKKDMKHQQVFLLILTVSTDILLVGSYKLPYALCLIRYFPYLEIRGCSPWLFSFLFSRYLSYFLDPQYILRVDFLLSSLDFWWRCSVILKSFLNSKVVKAWHLITSGS